MTTNKKADFIVEPYKGFLLFAPVTQSAEDWIEDNSDSEGRRRVDNVLIVENQFAKKAADSLLDRGLEFCVKTETYRELQTCFCLLLKGVQ